MNGLGMAQLQNNHFLMLGKKPTSKLIYSIHEINCYLVHEHTGRHVTKMTREVLRLINTKGFSSVTSVCVSSISNIFLLVGAGVQRVIC